MFFRGCNEELPDDKFKHCSKCRAKKSDKEFLCKKGGCTFHIENEDDEYCRKHIRELLRNYALKHNIHFCDIDRGCFNQLTSYDVKCGSCMDNEKMENALIIKVLREKHKIDPPTILYSSLNLIQDKKTITISELWRAVQRSAYARGLMFMMTEADFEKCVIQPCYYCGFYSLSRPNGIDRIDNNKGYIPSNSLPCCKMCNTIKNTQHPLEFLDKVNIIYNYDINKIPISESILTKWVSYVSSSIRETYNEYKYSNLRRDIKMSISEIEYNLLLQGKCYLCGIPNLKNHMNGIDRVDSSIKCYTIENSKTCCGHCNLMKGTLSLPDFIQKCSEINRHKCDRSIFTDIPVYIKLKARNEYYTADEIYTMMFNGSFMNYIEWCKEKNKTPEFISAINDIHHTETKKDICIQRIRHELERELSRTKKIATNELSDKKHIRSDTLYSYLTQGKINDYKEWYISNYSKTSLFDEKINELLDSLPKLSRDDGIEACRQFMNDEKNRRNYYEITQRQKKVIKYSNSSSSESTPTTTTNEIIYPDVIESPSSITSEKLEVLPIYELDSSLPPVIIIPKIIIKNDSIIDKVKTIQKNKGYIKVEIPKQWKSKSIHQFIQSNHENEYKLHCQENNTVPSSWEDDWKAFVSAVKGKSFIDSKPIIKAFVENLRRLRHNKLCAKTDLIEREDRQQWPSHTIVKAFLENKLDRFKAMTEEATSEIPDEPKWKKRWETFIADLEANRANETVLKNLCSKFIRAQRTKKYRNK